MPKRVDKQGVVGPSGVRYSRMYWAAMAGAFALLVVDLFDDSALWNYGVIVCVIIAIAVRPGGVRRARTAAPVDEGEASAAAAADEPTPHAT